MKAITRCIMGSYKMVALQEWCIMMVWKVAVLLQSKRIRWVARVFQWIFVLLQNDHLLHLKTPPFSRGPFKAISSYGMIFINDADIFFINATFQTVDSPNLSALFCRKLEEISLIVFTAASITQSPIGITWSKARPKTLEMLKEDMHFTREIAAPWLTLKKALGIRQLRDCVWNPNLRLTLWKVWFVVEW